MLKNFIFCMFILLTSNVVSAASKMTCISGNDQDYLQAEVTLDANTIVFSTTLYLDGEKVSIGNDELIVLKRKGKVFYNKTITPNFTTYRKALLINNGAEIELEEAQIGGDILLSALSTSYQCTK